MCDRMWSQTRASLFGIKQEDAPAGEDNQSMLIDGDWKVAPCSLFPELHSRACADETRFRSSQHRSCKCSRFRMGGPQTMQSVRRLVLLKASAQIWTMPIWRH